MTLRRGASGIYEGDFRAKGLERLHLSLRTKKRSDAVARHDAVQKLVRQKRVEMLEQLRAGVLSIERLEAMVEHHEPLAPIVLARSANGTTPERAWDTVDQASERYLAWMRAHPNRSERTTALAGFQLQRWRDYEHEGTRIGTLALDRVPSAVVQAYQQHLIASSPVNTATTYMSRVGALWTFAVDQELRDAREQRRAPRALYSPVDATMLVRETHRRDRVLTVEEGDRLLAATPAPLLFPVACGLLAGLRIGETLHLRPSLDVDLDLGTITIRKQPDWSPKTKRARRLVPMAPALLQVAKGHVTQFASASWMVPSPIDPSRPMTEDGFRIHFQMSVERAELVYGRGHAQGVTYHTLRHSFASHAVMRGVDLYTVAKLLGDSLKTVEDVYADLSPDFKRQAVAKLASTFSVPMLEGLVPSLAANLRGAAASRSQKNDTANDTESEELR